MCRSWVPTTLAVMTLAAAAWALNVIVPTGTLRAKAALVVDEAGHILFGATPAKVEVTNFPPITTDEQIVTLLDHVTMAPSGSLDTPIISTGHFGHLTLFADSGGAGVTATIFCAFALESWTSIGDSVPKVISAALQSNQIGSSTLDALRPGATSVQPAPILGPLFGCRLFPTSGATTVVTLQARLTQ